MTLQIQLNVDSEIEVPSAALQRGERLASDFLKVDMAMREHGIQHTIVVFGSTRITSSVPLPGDNRVDYYAIAREFGRIVGGSGKGPGDTRVTLMTGGGPGIMEAVNRGASDVGAKSIGLNIRLPREQVPNLYVSEELSFNFHYFAIRKLHFLLRARALVVFPGGFGTLDELFETLNLIQCRKLRLLPVVIVGRAFWERLIDFNCLREYGLVDWPQRGVVQYAESATEIWDAIIDWHLAAGKPLLNDA